MKIDDSELALPLLSPVCAMCKHLRIAKGRTCDAFPAKDSIPDPIWLGEDNHRTPYNGDHGIQFEAIDRSSIKAASDDDPTEALIDAEWRAALKWAEKAGE